MLLEKEIAMNLESVRKRCYEASERSGRAHDEVTLIAVSKMNPVEAIISASKAGQRVFGENKVQELCGKLEAIERMKSNGEIAEADFEFHLIGHLQTNKVRQVVGKVALIHSVDSYRLAEAIDRESAKCSVVSDILIEINIGDEESKFGVNPEEALNLVMQISLLKNVRIRGLMTVAPFTENAEDNRAYFRQMKQLCVDIASKNIDNVNMSVLSMGMTGDFEVAIEEGATLVRVGTGIFGARNYT